MTPMQKNKYSPRTVNGILLLDKPKGLSSNQAMQRVKHLFQAKKAGHTGSLDPLATGMLPICLGEATKFSHFLLDADKAYQTTAKLGIATSTGDAEGEITATKPVPILNTEIIEAVLAKFTGEIVQIPPMYSALKHQGQPLYKLARQGIIIEPKKRTVTIHAIQLLSFTEDTLSIEVRCSKGTYIRTLVEDIAKALPLNTVAHVQILRRLWVAPFATQTQFVLDELMSQTSLAALDKLLLPMDAGLQSLPKLILAELDVAKLQYGQAVVCHSHKHCHSHEGGNPDDRIRENDAYMSTLFRLYTTENIFLGIGEVKEDNYLHPKRLVNF